MNEGAFQGAWGRVEFLLIAVCCGLSAVSRGGELTLAEDGRARFVIVAAGGAASQNPAGL